MYTGSSEITLGKDEHLIQRSKMKLYDVEQQAQADLVDSGQDIPTQQVNTEDWKF